MRLDGEVVDLTHDSFPVASRYDASWLLSLDMGPHPLWLLEELLEEVAIERGARVLDLGCGRGATSVYLARELGAEVCAVDLWVPASEIQATVTAAGVGDLVTASNGDVRRLPFEDASFDAIVSIDAWEYFGTDDHLLPGLLRVLRPGGVLAMATPSMHRDVRELGFIPDHIKSVVGWEALAWHPPAWWQQQWELTGLVDDVQARTAASGWKDWLRWARAAASDPDADAVVEMLEADAGELLTFALVAARRR
jgi:ubiquinone/menaquinone biosynthesis C-methylase UbiE